MRLGIGSYTYTWAIGVPGQVPTNPMTTIELLNKAHALGVDVVQYNDNLPLTSLEKVDLDSLAQSAADYNIEIEIGTRGISPKNVQANLLLAKHIKAKFVRFVIDNGNEKPTADQVVSTLKPLMPMFADAGIVFAIENHDRFPATDLIRIVEALGTDNAGICLDTVNSLGCLETPNYVVYSLTPYTVNFHVKDFQIERIPSQMGFEVIGCPVGQGRLTVPWILNHLESTGRDINAIIELWTPFARTLCETIAIEDDWARQSVQYMRGLIPS